MKASQLLAGATKAASYNMILQVCIKIISAWDLMQVLDSNWFKNWFILWTKLFYLFDQSFVEDEINLLLYGVSLLTSTLIKAKCSIVS